MNSNLNLAVQELSPESRQHLLRIADHLSRQLRSVDLGTPQADRSCEPGTSMAAQPKLGVIMLDYDYEPAIGDIDHPASFAYPVVYRKVPGLTFGLCQEGGHSAEIMEEFKDAVKYLEAQGCAAITGDCGFMYWYQEAARTVTHKPMLLSSLCQLPAVTVAFGPEEVCRRSRHR